MTIKSVSVEVDVDVVLDDIDTEDLLDELKSRGLEAEQMTIEGHWDPIEGKAPHQLLDAIYNARVSRQDQRALELIDRLIYSVNGQIV